MKTSLRGNERTKMAIMQLHKKQKSWRTKSTAKAVKTTSTLLFPVVEYDFNVMARKSHTGYFHLLQIHFKNKYMQTTIKHEDVPALRQYPNELYEYLLFNTTLQTTIVGSIEEKGLVNASIALEQKLNFDEHLVSISLAPLKID